MPPNAYGTAGDPAYSSTNPAPAGSTATGSPQYGTMTPEQKAFVQSLPGRTNWVIRGTSPEIINESVPVVVAGKETGEFRTQRTDTGNEIWTLVAPDGQTDHITVRPNANAQPGGSEPAFALVKEPSRELKDSSGKGFTELRELDNGNNTKTVWGIDPTDHVFKPVPNPAQTADSSSPATITTTTSPTPHTTTGAESHVIGGHIIQFDPSQPAGKQWIDQGVFDENAKADAEAKIKQTMAAAGYDDARTQDLLNKSGPEIQKIISETNLSDAQKQEALSRIEIAKAELPSKIGLNTAQAENQASQAELNRRRAELEAAGLPADIALKQAEAERATAEARKASTTDLQAPEDQMFLVWRDAKGNIQQKPNPNFHPTDPARAVQQLQDQQRSYAQSLNDQVNGGTLSKEDAARQWDEWNQMNVEPLKQSIQQAQEQKAFVNATTNVASAATTTNAAANAQNAATQNLTAQAGVQDTASTVGKRAVDAALALPTGMTRVGPGFGTEMNKISSAMQSGQAPGNIDWNSAMVWQPPDTSKIYQDATAQALKGISPMAAQITSSPLPTVPSGLDVNALLNSGRGFDTYGLSPGATAAANTSTQANSTVGSAQQAAAAAGPAPTPGNTLASNDPAYIAWLKARPYQPAA